ncbi:MAG: cupredoxin domain-containing protein [Gemmatimonadaceae bacterium]|nr:cupredoxin domain-containing protein [Gemmatimonadaceae bacterium]
MRFYGIALLTGAAILGACGGENKSADSTAAATPAVDVSTQSATTPAGGAATTPATTGTMAAAPATGTTHQVKMIGDASGYKFEPANITVKAGDAIKWTMVTGGPHNVAFLNVTNAAAKSQLDANMSGAKMGELSSQMLMQPNEAYTISFANVPAGKYDYQCTPHAAMNMRGSVTVQ